MWRWARIAWLARTSYLTGAIQAGQGNHFHAGCVIGDLPQDLKYQGAPTRVTIGDHNVFREHVTVNRATTAGDATVVGSIISSWPARTLRTIASWAAR